MVIYMDDIQTIIDILTKRTTEIKNLQEALLHEKAENKSLRLELEQLKKQGPLVRDLTGQIAGLKQKLQKHFLVIKKKM